MTPEQRLRFIQRVERLGYTVETSEDRDGQILIITIWGRMRHVARSVSPCRYDWEGVARQFAHFQAQGSKTHRTRKAVAA